MLRQRWCPDKVTYQYIIGPLAKYLQLRVAHAPHFPATAGYQSRHASRHVRHARAVIHVGMVNQWFPLKSLLGKTFPVFPAHAQPAILRVWKEAHLPIFFLLLDNINPHTLNAYCIRCHVFRPALRMTISSMRWTHIMSAIQIQTLLCYLFRIYL